VPPVAARRRSHLLVLVALLAALGLVTVAPLGALEGGEVRVQEDEPTDDDAEAEEDADPDEDGDPDTGLIGEEPDEEVIEGADDPDEPAAERVQGRLFVPGGPQEDDEPVPDVVIALLTPEGDEIDAVDTDEDGRFEIGAPGPGSYRVSLDPAGLPDGVDMRFPDRDELEIRLAPNQVANVAFPLAGEGFVAGGDTEAARAARLFASGLRFGLTIALCAVGLSLIFGTTGLVNFAHGELVTFGALIAYMFNRTFGIHLLGAVPLALVVCALAGGALDRGFWRPLRSRGTGLIAMLVISIGLGLLLRYIFIYQFGDRRQTFAQYQIQTDGFAFGPVTLVPREMYSIVVAAVVLVIVALVLQLTKLGKAMRAVADNKDLAESSGIDVQRVINVVWMAGAALAGLGGVLLGLAEQIAWNMGFNLLLLMFAGVILGGLGTAYGALVGGIAIGIVVQTSTFVLPTELKNVAALFVLIVILLVRPQGILGQAERVG
jgi:neutral amino acid transport system permease protein